MVPSYSRDGGESLLWQQNERMSSLPDDRHGFQVNNHNIHNEGAITQDAPCDDYFQAHHDRSVPAAG